jgi:hypothetical protein
MKIKRHVHIEGQLQRSIVECGLGTLHRRIARFINCEDGTLLAARPESAQWQECIPTGEFHNILCPTRARFLEDEFILALIKSTVCVERKEAVRTVMGMCAPSIHPDDMVPSRQPANT